MMSRSFAMALATIALRLSMLAQNTKIEISLPTDNDVLYCGGGPDFYQYFERDYQGV